MSSNFYPTQLRSFVNKLHGFSQTTVKLSPLSGTLNAGPRSTVVVSLPPNSLILPESFTLWARATTSGSLQTVGGAAVNLPGNTAAAATPATHPVVALPNNAESLIKSVALTANGQSIDAGPGSNCNQLFNLLADVQLGGKKNERAIAQLGGDVPSQTYGTNGEGTGTPANGTTGSSTQYGNILPAPTVYTSIAGPTKSYSRMFRSR